MTSSSIQQTVTGDHNIFTATGDINVTYTLPPADAADHHNLTILLDRVDAFWIDGVLEHSVMGDMAHALIKDDAANTVEHPWESVLELPGERARVLGRGASASLYRLRRRPDYLASRNDCANARSPPTGSIVRSCQATRSGPGASIPWAAAICSTRRSEAACSSRSASGCTSSHA